MHALETIAVGRPIIRGPLALYPLYGHGLPAREYIPGPVASERGLLQIDETDGGSVPTLNAVNAGALPILIVEGETFAGGLQNRVLNVTVLLGQGNSKIAVSCVEAHRWGGRTEMQRADIRAPRRLRREKNASVHHSVKRDGSRSSDQGAVWAEVDSVLACEGVSAPTSSLLHAYEANEGSSETMRAVDSLAEIGPLAGQTGVVIAAGGRCLSAELFDRPETLQAYWRQIVTSHRFDLPTRVAEPPSVSRVLRFIDRVNQAEHTAVPGVGLGTEHHWSSSRIVAQGLECDDALVHLSLLAA